jgi:hypothetical protein
MKNSDVTIMSGAVLLTPPLDAGSAADVCGIFVMMILVK